LESDLSSIDINDSGTLLPVRPFILRDLQQYFSPYEGNSMRRNMVVVLVLVGAAAFALAQYTPGVTRKASGTTVAVRGYVVDAMCAQGIVKKGEVMKRAAAHTKACALEDNCAASGYGVFSDGKYLKFDTRGDQLAHTLLQKTAKEKDIAVEVTGTMTGTQFAVASIKEITMDDAHSGTGAGRKEKAMEQQ
jgi:hypothetical protein